MPPNTYQPGYGYDPFTGNPQLPNPYGPAPVTDSGSNDNALTIIQSRYPWLTRITSTAQLRAWAVEGLSPEAVVQAIRELPTYQNFFRGIRREDGTMRMSEAEYFDLWDDYTQVHNQLGLPAILDTRDIEGYIVNEMDPNEVRQRGTLYRNIEVAGQDVIDAFYVFAGINVSEVDLFNAVVYPNYWDTLEQTYNARVAGSSTKYEEWVFRATERGLQRVTRSMNELKKMGIVTSGQMTQFINSRPEDAQVLMDALYTGRIRGETPEPLTDLASLERAFENAVIGGVASGQGLALPTQERIELFRLSGVDRAKAQEAYSFYAARQGYLQGMVTRFDPRQAGFSQADFENAVFLQSAPEAEIMRKAQAYEEGLGRSRGYSALSQGQNGQLVQRGLRTL